MSLNLQDRKAENEDAKKLTTEDTESTEEDQSSR